MNLKYVFNEVIDPKASYRTVRKLQSAPAAARRCRTRGGGHGAAQARAC